MDEAHVQHPVRLVQHHGFRRFHPDGAALHVVGEPSRRGHHDLGMLFQRVDLTSDGRAAVEAHRPDAGLVGIQHPQLVGDLDGQLPRGSKDHRLNAVVLRVDMLHNGNPIGKGLAGAGGSLGDHVPPRQHRRDTARLHRGGLYNIAFQQSAQQLRRQLQRVKPNALCQFHGHYPHIYT